MLLTSILFSTYIYIYILKLIFKETKNDKRVGLAGIGTCILSLIINTYYIYNQ